MKKLSLLAMGLLLSTSTCFADAEVLVTDVDSAFLQKYVIDTFYNEHPQYTLESRTAEKVTYVITRPLEKKDTVVGKTREEVIFTTVQKGKDVAFGLQQQIVDNYRDGKVDIKKNSKDLDDLIFLNKYRTFFNDSYTFKYTPNPKASKEGVGILSVYGIGPMHDAGILSGAIITAINGQSVVGKLAEVKNGLIPDQFSSAPVTFTVKTKTGTKDYVLTPVVIECKYTQMKQKQAQAQQEIKEGKRGIESWLKL